MDRSLIPESWRSALETSLANQALRGLDAFLQAEEAAGKIVYPPRHLRFSAIDLAPLPAAKVVILGQDPYHGAGQAHGLAFSVLPGVRIPPSLRNIFTELETDLGLARPAHGNLESWARQGVLMLNTALTVEAARPGSHSQRGWEALTDAMITAVAARPAPTVFLLWGNHAQTTAARIPALQSGPHQILSAPHPSPLSAYKGFYGCRHFSQTNAFLEAHGRGSIDWSVPNEQSSSATD